MHCTPLDFSELGFPGLFTDYLKNKPEVHFFYNGLSPFEVISYVRKAKEASGQQRLNRSEASDLLMHFNAPFEPSGETIKNILALGEENSFTVVTGQQLSLFGGPLYTLYKTISVIALSRQLTENTGLKVIPVFWMADEDHDFEEIRFTKAPDVSQKLFKAELKHVKKQDFSAGRLTLDEEVQAIKDTMIKIPGFDAEAKRDLSELISDWQPGTSWKTAFGKMMMRLFGKYGLVLAGSDDKRIKKAMSPVQKKGIVQADMIHEKLEHQSALINRSYHAQAAVTSSQFFWHDDKHGRIKVPFENGKWQLPGAGMPLSPDEAASFIDKNNLWAHLSPNVFMRPVLQEYLLPNLAYVGGGAELAYHGQMKTVFEFFKLSMPLLLPRISATVLEPATERAISGTGFRITDFRRPARELKREWVEQFSGYEVNETFKKWTDELHRQFESRAEFVEGLDKSLAKSAASTLVRMEQNLESLREKTIRAVKNKEDVQMKRIERASEALFPNRVLQEREYGFAYMIAAHGSSFTDSLIEACKPDALDFMKAHQIIKP